MRVVQAFRREGLELRRLPRGERRVPGGQPADGQRQRPLLPVRDLLSSMAMAIVLGYGGVRVLEGEITAGALFVFIGLLTNFFDPVQQLSQFYQTFLAGTAALDKVFEVLDTEPRLVDGPGAPDLPEIGAGSSWTTCGSHTRGTRPRCCTASRSPSRPVRRWRWSGTPARASRPSSSCWPGSTTPPAARSQIDGHDLRDVSMRSLRRQLGIVPQEGFLFAGTVRENIAFGRPDASMEDVVAAATAVGADGFIRELPDGYELGDRGARRPALDRAAAAGRVRPGAAGQPAAADPGRGHVQRRHSHRGADRRGAGHAAAAPHVVRRRAPALHDPPRRPDRRAGARRGDRAGHARAADRAAGPVLRAVRGLGRRGA